MKKFLIIFFLLLILGFGFFFGWANLGVPADSFGIVRSKTHGIDPRLVKPGEFRWIWQKLIPANTKTSVFRLAPVNYEFSANNTLPQGAVYGLFAGVPADFSWEMNAVFSFTIKPDALIPLAKTHNISSQEDLENYETKTAEQIEAFIIRRMNIQKEYVMHIEELLKNGESAELEKDIMEHFENIENFTISIKTSKIPDYDLYFQAKELYESFLAKQKDHSESHERFFELERYGILLSKYPILLDYLIKNPNSAASSNEP